MNATQEDNTVCTCNPKHDYNHQLHYTLSMHQSLLTFGFPQGPSFDVKSEASTEGEEMQFRHDCISFPSMVSSFSTGSSKAKSSLCKNFMQRGHCPYGNKCQFAHGPQELRINMEHNRSYKTKGCHAFSKKGYCCFGDRCNFIHEKGEGLNLRDKWIAIYSNHRETLHAIEKDQGSQLLTLLGLPQ